MTEVEVEEELYLPNDVLTLIFNVARSLNHKTRARIRILSKKWYAVDADFGILTLCHDLVYQHMEYDPEHVKFNRTLTLATCKTNVLNFLHPRYFPCGSVNYTSYVRRQILNLLYFPPKPTRCCGDTACNVCATSTRVQLPDNYLMWQPVGEENLHYYGTLTLYAVKE